MAVGRYGSTTRASPNASITPIRSTAPPPKPPKSVDTGRPVSPISASCAHTLSLQPSFEATIFLRDSKS